MREKSTHSVKLELLFAILLKYLYVGSGRVFRKFSDINSMRARMPGLFASTAGAYVFHAFLKGKQQNRNEDLYVLVENNMTKVIVSSNFILYSCLLLEIDSIAELFLRKKICRMKKYIFVKTCPRLPNENAFTLDI